MSREGFSGREKRDSRVSKIGLASRTRVASPLAMNLSVRGVILFVEDVETLGAFYRDTLGLKLKPSPDDPGRWPEFEAGACSIALHDGGVPNTSRRAPKIVFYAQDVNAVRASLVARGVKMGRVQSSDDFRFCDGKDPRGERVSTLEPSVRVNARLRESRTPCWRQFLEIQNSRTGRCSPLGPRRTPEADGVQSAPCQTRNP